MSKFVRIFLITNLFIFTSLVAQQNTDSNELAKGLNVMVTTSDNQTQLMAMVLSLQTIKKHSKEVNMVLCGKAGELALKSTVTPKLKPRDVSPSMLLRKIIELGANVSICPLYLPNANKTKEDLIEGITIAKPPIVAEFLLNKEYKNLTF